jgi:hypothetical protein
MSNVSDAAFGMVFLWAIVFLIPTGIGRSVGIFLLNLVVLPVSVILTPITGAILWFICLFAAFNVRNRRERRQEHRELVRIVQSTATPRADPLPALPPPPPTLEMEIQDLVRRSYWPWRRIFIR